MINFSKEFIPTAKENFWPMLKSEWLQWRLNKTPLWNIPMRNWLLRHLIGSIDGSVFAVQNPFHISFGNRTHLGKNFFANNGCIIYDHGGVEIGDNVMLGPNVIITSVSHPIDVEKRAYFHYTDGFEPQKRAYKEVCAPVTIGNKPAALSQCRGRPAR